MYWKASVAKTASPICSAKMDETEASRRRLTVICVPLQPRFGGVFLSSPLPRRYRLKAGLVRTEEPAAVN